MIDLIVATMNKHNWQPCVKSWADGLGEKDRLVIMHNDIQPRTIMESYNVAIKYWDLMYPGSNSILGFAHDDMICHDPNWRERILAAFDDPEVQVVGVAGALGHGLPHIYKEPFDIPHLSRVDFLSNMKDAEVHGRRFTGECEVSVLDGVALFVRRSWMEFEIGYWPEASPAGYWLYAEWLCCETRRAGGKIKLVGLPVEHLGGQTSSRVNVTDDFEKAHIWLKDNYADVLPWHVERGGLIK